MGNYPGFDLMGYRTIVLHEEQSQKRGLVGSDAGRGRYRAWLNRVRACSKAALAAVLVVGGSIVSPALVSSPIVPLAATGTIALPFFSLGIVNGGKSCGMGVAKYVPVFDISVNRIAPLVCVDGPKFS